MFVRRSERSAKKIANGIPITMKEPHQIEFKPDAYSSLPINAKHEIVYMVCVCVRVCAAGILM